MKKIHWFFRVLILLILFTILWFGITILLPKLLPTKLVTGEIRGIIFQNQVWNGNIYIVGDLITLPNVQIEILAGSKVFINKNGDKHNFDLLPWHLRDGINTGLEYHGILNGDPFWDEKEKIQIHISNLQALGHPDNQIIISSFPEEGSPYDINLIKVNNGELSNIKFSNYRRLEIGQNVKLTQNYFANTGDCAVCVTNGSPLISENVFKKGKRNYIEIQSGEPLIKTNRFLEGEGDGILIIEGGINQIRIFYNVFEIPSKKAIKILSGSSVGISNNRILLGDIEMPCKNNTEIFNNLIKVKILFKNVGNCAGEYELGENYWEIKDTESILEARISGTSDKFKVKVPRILKFPPKNLPYVTI